MTKNEARLLAILLFTIGFAFSLAEPARAAFPLEPALQDAGTESGSVDGGIGREARAALRRVLEDSDVPVSDKGASAMSAEGKEGNVEGRAGERVEAGQVARDPGLVKTAHVPDEDVISDGDGAIEQGVKEKLAADPRLSGVRVEVEDGVVTLSGHLIRCSCETRP
jgi:BON domain